MKILKQLFIPILIILIIGGCTSFSGPAKDIELITLFGDNMVLQRDIVLPIWGTADAVGNC